MSRVKQSELINSVIKEPNICECAYFVKRPISVLPWVRGVSSNDTLDKINLELSHQHIVFSDTKQNIGFGPAGYFSDSDNKVYFEQSKCYDASLVRDSIRKFFESKYVIKKHTYNLFKNNCQHFIDNIFKYLGR